MRHDDLSGIAQGLDLAKTFLQKESETAFIEMGIAKDPYPSQIEILNSRHKILAFFGANRCLRCDAEVQIDPTTRKRLDCMEVGDEVVAFDFARMAFVPARVRSVFHNGRWMIFRYRHSEGVLECTASHKVCVMYPKSGRLAMVRVNRAVKEQLPVVVRNAQGAPVLSEISFDGRVALEATMDLQIDHPDHAFVCNGVVVSNSGKALPNSEPVLTPHGFIPMGEVQVGMEVCTPRSGSASVTGVFPQGVREVWEIEFNDGSTCRCDLDHLWEVRSCASRARKVDGAWEILTLRQIMARSGERPKPVARFMVPSSTVEFALGHDLPLDPYSLGLLIGDGSMSQSKAIGFTTVDEELVDHLRKTLPVSKFNHHGQNDWSLTNGRDGSKKNKNKLIEIIRDLGLMGSKSRDKFIPKDYKMSSQINRLGVLQGLMDTDGTVGKDGRSSFVSTSKTLADDVAWLCRSLGIRCSVTSKVKYCTYKGVKKACGCWEVYIGKAHLPLFRLKRKRDRQELSNKIYYRIMCRFNRVSDEECTCIKIDSDERLFITKDFIPTHNTHTMMVKAAWDATGLYPDWYRGEKTVRGIDAWVMGDTGENTRDTAQRKLFGPEPERPGWTDKPFKEALIPAKYIIGKPSRKSAPAGCFDTVRVKHVPSDTTSILTFKSHKMDRQSLASWHGNRVYIDEECNKDILDEMVARVMDDRGQIFMALCPLEGMTPTVKFLQTAPEDLVKVCYLSHTEAKHLDEGEKETIRRLYASNPAMLIARTEGRVVQNHGLIFPFPLSDLLYDPAKISISSRWPALGGADVGWRHPWGATAGARDPLSDVIYVYATYEKAEQPYLYHHAQLNAWGENMTFMIDPASNQAGQATGVKILEELWKLAHGKDWEDIPEDKRKYIKADNTFQTGMDEMWNRFNSGRLKFSRNLRTLHEQYEAYAWNKNGDGPKEETPDLKYDVITGARYMTAGFRDGFDHTLEQAPWLDDYEWDSTPVEQIWTPYRSGRNG